MLLGEYSVRVEPQLPRSTTVGAGLIPANWNPSLRIFRADLKLALLKYGGNPLATPVTGESLDRLALTEGYGERMFACRA